MIGTFLNTAAILAGGGLGLLFGRRLPERLLQTLVAAMGLFTAVIGFQMTLKSSQILVVLGSLLIGGLLGEWWRIEDGLRRLGVWLEKHFSSDAESTFPVAEPITPAAPGAPLHQTSRFLRGFLTASLLFAIGPMAILGSIQDGLQGDVKLLAIKSALDFFGSVAFASSLGVGVLFSSLIILVYQGALTLLAVQAQSFITTPMMNEMTATGGVLLLGIAISGILEIKPIRVANLLPALFVAPLLVALLAAIGLPLNP